MRKRSGARRGRKGGGQRRRGGPARDKGVGVEVKGEEGELVPEAEDGDGDENGDEVLEEPPPPPPPTPCFTPPRVAAKGPRQRSKESTLCHKAAVAPWSAQVLEQGCGPKPNNFTSPHTIPCGGTWAEFFGASLGKMGRARGSGGKTPPKGAPGTGNQCRAVPCAR